VSSRRGKQVLVDSDEDLTPYGTSAAIVVVDVIRATTTLATAVASGRRCFAVGSVDAAVRAAAELEEPLLAGELGGDVPEGFDLNNSPAEFASRADTQRPVVLLTTSGTRLLASAAPGQAVFAACLRNWSAEVERLADSSYSKVCLVGAPTRGEFRVEDQICCSWIASGLMEHGFAPADERTSELVARWRDVPVAAIARGHSAGYLRDSGQMADLDFVIGNVDDLDLSFALDGSEIVAVNGRRIRHAA
jgi:2-phosphosulfolactate phosphatase